MRKTAGGLVTDSTMGGWMRVGITILLGALLPVLFSEPAGAAELYLSGDIGVSFGSGDGKGFIIPVGSIDKGSSEDASPVYGGSLGISFPLNQALPWRWRSPEVRIPYWPGRALEFGGKDTGFPDWDTSFEVEYLGGRNYDLATRSFNAQDPYRSDVDSWSVMGKLRMDFPVRPLVQKIVGRVPFLDPLTIYVGGGAGLGVSELDASQASAFGSDDSQEFAWQGTAGVGYQLSDRVRWSAGWRYQDLGKPSTGLADVTNTPRGSYSIDLRTHEFSTTITIAFWRLPTLGKD